MNIEVVKNAIGGLDKVFGNAKDAVRQIEAEAYGYETYIGYENPEGALGYFLDEIGTASRKRNQAKNCPVRITRH